MGVRTCRLLEVVEGLNRQPIRERVTAEHALDEAQGEEGSGTVVIGHLPIMPSVVEGHTVSARRSAAWTTHAGLAVVAALLVASGPVPLVGSAVAWPLASDPAIDEEPRQVAAKPSSPSVPSLNSPVAHPTIITDPPPTLPRHDRQGASRSRR